MSDVAKPPSRLHDSLRDGLVRLIEIPSPSYHEKALADHLEARLGAVPATSLQRLEDNLILRWPACAGRPMVILAGHLDTVPAQDNLTPVVDGDLVRGLGASDLKAGLAVFLELIDGFDPGRCPFDPVFVFYAREEIGFDESGLIEIEQAWPQIRDAEFAICVEPTDNAVELGCLGTLHAEITVHGRTAHSARPWQGLNAIHASLPLLQRLAAVPDREIRCGPEDSLLYTEVLNVTRIESTGARNVIPGQVRLNVNFRFGPDRTPDLACDLVRELVGDDGEVKFVDVAPSGRLADANPLCRQLLDIAGGVSRAKQAWTDVGRFTTWGVDAVSFGPGLGSQAHQKDEYASIAAMVDSHAMFVRFLQPSGVVP